MGRLLSMPRNPVTLVHVILASLHSQPLGQTYVDEVDEVVTALSRTSSATSTSWDRCRLGDDDATPDDVIFFVRVGQRQGMEALDLS